MKIYDSFHIVMHVMLVMLLVSSALMPDVPVIVPLSEYENNILDSGGKLVEEQAALDVYYYELDLTIDPYDSTINGSVLMQSHVMRQLDTYVAHLDTVFDVHHVHYHHPDDESPLRALDFTHENGLVIAQLPHKLEPGEKLKITVFYSGSPRMAPNPPWEGGFTWDRTDNGEPWFGVSCQVNGADIWWPVKDHPSDRPDSVSLSITVPESLTAVSNGVLRSVDQRMPGTKTFHWVTRHPISNYAVTVNAGPYVELERKYESITGQVFPIYFWALPRHREKADELMDQIVHQMRFLEQLLGPYPYRDEKYGVVEAPFFGMEHQTIIAYGAGYQNDTVFDTNSGFDDLHHHELSHEWWGNLVTASDWKDFWIHEGFGTYMQPLYAEHLHGKEQYRYFMKRLYQRILNNLPIAPDESRTTREMFDGRDIYMKGAWVLHTLRKLIGDDAFFTTLAEMTYPNTVRPSRPYGNSGASDYRFNSNATTGSKSISEVPARFTDTRDYINLVRVITGQDLKWFFYTYLKHSDLPELLKKWDDDSLILSWSTPSDYDFPMPVEVCDGQNCMSVIPDGETAINIRHRDELKIDPHNKVLRSGLYR